MHFRKALLFAFHDEPLSCDRILHADGMDDLLRFVEKQPDCSLYVVVDQRNALDLDGEADKDRKTKAAAWGNINRLRAFQRYIFSASANEKSALETELKQTDVRTIFFRAGLDEVCPHLFNYLVSFSPGED
jgi:hypothetical protein